MKKKITIGVGIALAALPMAATFAMASDFDAIGAQDGYAENFGSLIEFVMRLALGVGALLVFAYLILGGIEYITSGGEKGKTEAARNKITSAVVGLIILGASYAILNLALTFLGIGSLQEAINNVDRIDGTGSTGSPDRDEPGVF